MTFKKYKFLNKNKFIVGDYSIVPIRCQDRFDIMRWRNEQIYHLRQEIPLTEVDQDDYFNNVVARLFEQDQPDQALFSYLEGGKCIGYGGLVHISWTDKNAEISFVLSTKLENNFFHKHWGIYLNLIEQVAFEELSLHKIYTYAFDVRSHLYGAIEANGFVKEAVLKEHCFFNGEFKNVIIHSKMNRGITIRKACEDDAIMTYKWTNDKLTRKNSFSSDPISLQSHKIWWHLKLNDVNTFYYICEIEKKPGGIVRFDKDEKSGNYIVSLTVAPSFRGKGMAGKFLRIACSELFKSTDDTVDAYIKKENTISVKAFERSGFKFSKLLTIKGNEVIKYQLKKHEE